MVPLEQRFLPGREKAASAAQRQQVVLGNEQGMVFSQPLLLPPDIVQVVRVVFSHFLPVIAEMPPCAVPFLHLQVGLLDLFQQGSLIPGCPVMDRGHVGGRAHGFEFFVVLLLAYVLGFVDLQQDVGGGADHAGGLVRGKEELPGPAQGNHVTHLGTPHPAVAGVVETFLQPQHAVYRLGLKGRGGLDRAAAPGQEQGQEQHLDLGGEFVLAALARYFHGKGEPPAMQDAVQDGPADFDLVWAESYHRSQ